MFSDDLICVYISVLLFLLTIPLFCGCCLHQRHKSRASQQVDLADAFLKFVDKNHECIDIDKFIKGNHITLNDFYEKILKRIVGNKKKFQASVTYRFQGCTRKALISDVGVFARSLCLQYLSILFHSSVNLLPAEEFLKVCDNVYLLNTEPGNLQKRFLIYKFIVSPNRYKFIASCLFLLDKKIKGFHNSQSVLQDRDFLQVVQRGANTYIKRRDCQDLVLVIDSKGYLTALLLNR